jgi:anti-sigma B factor antagonist
MSGPPWRTCWTRATPDLIEAYWRTEEGIVIDLTLDTRSHGGWTVVAVRGELDLYTAPQLREHVVQLADDASGRLVIDLDEVGFIDSSGLGVIVACLKRCREQGGDLVLVAPEQSPVTKLLALTGLTSAIPVAASIDDVTG